MNHVRNEKFKEFNNDHICHEFDASYERKKKRVEIKSRRLKSVFRNRLLKKKKPHNFVCCVCPMLRIKE